MIKYKQTIIQSAEDVTGVPAQIICGAKRTDELVNIRDICATIIKEELGSSDQSIALSLKRNRSSITYGHMRHSKKMQNSPFYQNLYWEIKKACRAD
jgi:chromosomal replication initiation ATPase DnaA